MNDAIDLVMPGGPKAVELTGRRGMASTSSGRFRFFHLNLQLDRKDERLTSQPPDGGDRRESNQFAVKQPGRHPSRPPLTDFVR
jgi:hypothetical protein